jgi:hypothetical protein
MDLLNYENTIKKVIDSFRKMCDYIEQSKEGCKNCPVFKDCFYNGKHNGLKELMDDLNIK